MSMFDGKLSPALQVVFLKRLRFLLSQDGMVLSKALLKIAQGNPYVELFENSEALRERLEKREMTGITFLVKGSRGTRLERAIPALL